MGDWNLPQCAGQAEGVRSGLRRREPNSGSGVAPGDPSWAAPLVGFPGLAYTKLIGLLMESHVVAFSDDKLDRTFAALAHPTRRAILTRLVRSGSASVTELAEPFDVSLMAISKHLKVMSDAGLIRREKDGRVHRCFFDPASIDVARDWIEVHRTYWTQQLDSLAAYLEEKGKGSERLHNRRGENG